MIISLEEAREYLRLDNTDNDTIIEGLIKGAEEYIRVGTGIPVSLLTTSDLAKTIAKMLLSLWYDSTQIDTDKLQRTIDTCLKSLSFITTEETNSIPSSEDIETINTMLDGINGESIGD